MQVRSSPVTYTVQLNAPAVQQLWAPEETSIGAEVVLKPALEFADPLRTEWSWCFLRAEVSPASLHPAPSGEASNNDHADSAATLVGE